MTENGASHLGCEPFPVHRERGAGWHPVLVGSPHDQRIERAHLLVKQPNCVMLSVVGPEAVRADHLRELITLVSGCGVTPAAHFRQTNPKPGLRQLPGSLASGQTTTDNVNVELSLRQDSLYSAA